MRGVASLEGDNLLIFYYLMRGAASLEGDNLLVFYVNYLPQERPPLSSGQIADVSLR
jgi:hypothetical protein